MEDLVDVVSRHMGKCTTWQESKSGHTLQARLIQSLSILGQGSMWTYCITGSWRVRSMWSYYITGSRRMRSMWTYCITGLRRVQSILINQPLEFTHFLVISYEYGGERMTTLYPWKRLFRSTGTGLTPSISDYLQTIGQAMVVGRRAERYLHDYVRSWITFGRAL